MSFLKTFATSVLMASLVGSAAMAAPRSMGMTGSRSPSTGVARHRLASKAKPGVQQAKKKSHRKTNRKLARRGKNAGKKNKQGGLNSKPVPTQPGPVRPGGQIVRR